MALGCVHAGMFGARCTCFFALLNYKLSARAGMEFDCLFYALRELMNVRMMVVNDAPLSILSN